MGEGGIGKQGRGKEGGGGGGGSEEGKDVKENDETRVSERGGKEIEKGVEGLYIILYLEYQSVCPFVRIGSPSLFSRKRVCPPLGTKRGATFACGRGARGANLDDWRESLALCLLCGEGGINEGKDIILLYLILHCFIRLPSDPMCRRML